MLAGAGVTAHGKNETLCSKLWLFQVMTPRGKEELREGSVSSWRGKGESSLSHDSYQDAKEVGVHGGATYKILDLSSADI